MVTQMALETHLEVDDVVRVQGFNDLLLEDPELEQLAIECMPLVYPVSAVSMGGMASNESTPGDSSCGDVDLYATALEDDSHWVAALWTGDASHATPAVSCIETRMLSREVTTLWNRGSSEEPPAAIHPDAKPV
jgi:hypothetical protein